MAMHQTLVFSVLLFFIFCLAQPPLLNVHIVSHTHNDVGWDQTVQQYYDNAVVHILDTVTTSLEKDPSRRFIYVEIKFFSMWWYQQTETKKASVRQLVKEGRLEFINAGWCMNDEAATHYRETADQMTLGHRFLHQEFGLGIPRLGWHIDPFGHANTQGAQFADIGFDAFFFTRIDNQEKSQYASEKKLEFVWRGSKSLGANNDIFTHVFVGGYCGGCDYNPSDPTWADRWVADVRYQASTYATNNVMVPYGCDFAFQNAEPMFQCMDSLISYINAHKDKYNINVFYSTPSIYLDALHKANLTWPIHHEDFFPIQDGDHAYWSGFFTSRPALKGFVRSNYGFQKFATQLYSLVPSKNVNPIINKPQLFDLAQVNGILTHHDAITGTEKQYVTWDYISMMTRGLHNGISAVVDILGNFIKKSTSTPSLSICPLLNESICAATTSLQSLPIGQFLPVIIYNSATWLRTDLARLPVPVSNLQVLDINGRVVPSDNLMEFGQRFLYFTVNLPASGYTTYFIGRTAEDQTIQSVKRQSQNFIENEFYRVHFANNVAYLIEDKQNSLSVPVSQNFMFYNPEASPNTQNSGAYIFRPNGASNAVAFGNPTSFSLSIGKVVQQANQYWNNWIYQTVRLYPGSRSIEFQANVGPIDISNGLGKEIISRFNSSLANGKTWYTDSQGQEFQQRIFNYRFDFQFSTVEPQAANYFPVNFAIYIQDHAKNLQLSLVTDRSRAGSSQDQGSFDTMVHRRLLRDDSRGVGEALNESNPINIVDNLVLDTIPTAAKNLRYEGQRKLNPLHYIFGSPSTVANWNTQYYTTWTALKSPLPLNVYLETLTPVQFPQSSNQYILRLHHLFAVGEDSVLSQPVTVSLKGLFVHKDPTSIEETNLTAVLSKTETDANRLKWKTVSNDKPAFPKKINADPYTITLNPMETRTFLVTFQDI